jgi:Fic-DOC domain mobile mystery protein B
MIAPPGQQDEAATPLSEEEKEELIPSYITLRSELNEAEQANILLADEWAFARRRDVLSASFLDRLHQRMLGRVWRWAGTHRLSDKNIGVEVRRIASELRQLLDDCRYWVENNTYEPDEIAVRFHHRLVWIHAYSNGNGRHARLATDLLLVSLGRPRFSWGGGSLMDVGTVRERYIAALRAADRHDLQPLMAFVRS